jgi:uncharacterized membrane protein
MDEDDERGDGDVALGRTLALSDGIFAISMTLLAFQIQAPALAPRDVHTLSHRLAAMGDTYYVYVLSFSVIGLLWLIHHRLFRHIARADEALMGVNLAFLMVVAVLPFPSSLLGHYGNERVSVILYASVMCLAGCLLATMTLLVEHRHLLGATASAEGVRMGRWRALATAAVFAVSIPVAYVAPKHAPLIWLATALTRLLPRKPRRRSSR